MLIRTLTVTTLSFALIAVFMPAVALNIDTTDKYAWGENIGWINFGTTEGDVDVSATELDGYAWGENVGWISLNCSNTSSCGTVDYSVAHDGSGTLSGYAWGENIGWVSFSCSNTSSCGTVNYGVTFDTGTGAFSGYAWGENIGWISFNCSNTSSCGTVDYKVITSYSATPTPTPTATQGPTGGGGPPPEGSPGVSASPSPTGSVSPTPSPTLSPTLSPTVTPTLSPTPTPPFSPTPSGTLLPSPTGFPTPTAPPPTVTPPTAPPGVVPLTPVVETVNKIAETLDIVAETILGPVADIVKENCVGPLGTAACGSTSVATVAVGVAAAAAVAQNEVAAASFSFFQIIGIRKRSKVWGVIYDSKTKRPIPMAKIELLDMADRVLETRFADREGRYGFLTSPSSLHQAELHLQVRVQKPGYAFPSKESVPNEASDYIVYQNIYRGGEITLKGDSLVKFDIPMDPVSKARTSLSGFGLGLIGALGDKLLSFAFYIGLVTVPLNLWMSPTTKNWVIAAVFIIMNSVRMFAIYRPYGVTVDATTGKKLPFALVTLNDLEGKREGFAVSDEHGRFILSGEKGKDHELVAYTPANVTPQRSIKKIISGLRRWATRAWVTATLRI